MADATGKFQRETSSCDLKKFAAPFKTPKAIPVPRARQDEILEIRSG